LEFLVLIFFGLAGIIILLTPVRALLNIDYGIGKIRFKRAKTEKLGLQSARKFYNQIGMSFIFVSIVGLLILYVIS